MPPSRYAVLMSRLVESRAPPSHAARRTFPHRGPQDLVRNDRKCNLLDSYMESYNHRGLQLASGPQCEHTNDGAGLLTCPPDFHTTEEARGRSSRKTTLSNAPPEGASAVRLGHKSLCAILVKLRQTQLRTISCCCDRMPSL